MTIMNRITDKLFAEDRTFVPPEFGQTEGEGYGVPIHDLLSKAEKVVKQNPGISILAAAGAGLILGWLVKRT